MIFYVSIVSHLKARRIIILSLVFPPLPNKTTKNNVYFKSKPGFSSQRAILMINIFAKQLNNNYCYNNCNNCSWHWNSLCFCFIGAEMLTTAQPVRQWTVHRLCCSKRSVQPVMSWEEEKPCSVVHLTLEQKVCRCLDWSLATDYWDDSQDRWCTIIVKAHRSLLFGSIFCVSCLCFVLEALRLSKQNRNNE